MCPVFKAQLASIDVELDPEGVPLNWMTSAEVPEASEQNVVVYAVPRPPSIMLSTCDDASFLIADTGCQRQVAGSMWHKQKQTELLPLRPLHFPEVCRFSFGPTTGMPSQGRYLYPAGIAGEPVALGISEVQAAAPGLLSRATMEALGAVPDILEGTVYFKALKKSTRLYLSPCRHLALKIDEWPSEKFAWPGQLKDLNLPHGPPDVYHPKMFPPEQCKLQALSNVEVASPPPHANQGRSTLMAGALASTDASPPGVHLHDEASGAVLLGGHPQAPLQGCDPQCVPGPVLGGDHDDGNDRDREVPAISTQAGLLRPHAEDQGLLGRGHEDPDLGDVWGPVGADFNRSRHRGKAEGKPQRQDTSGADRSSEEALRRRRRLSTVGVLTFIGGLIAGTIQGSGASSAAAALRMDGPTGGDDSDSESLPASRRQWRANIHSGTERNSDTDSMIECDLGGQTPNRRSRSPSTAYATDPNIWEERMGRDDWESDMVNSMLTAMRRDFETQGILLGKSLRSSLHYILEARLTSVWGRKTEDVSNSRPACGRDSAVRPSLSFENGRLRQVSMRPGPRRGKPADAET